MGRRHDFMTVFAARQEAKSLYEVQEVAMQKSTAVHLLFK
jgi:hypothetical protein